MLLDDHALGIGLVVGLQVCRYFCDQSKLIHGSDRRTRLAPEYCMIDFRPTFPLKLTAPCSSSPGIIVANTHSVGASLMVWLASGLLAWTGASSFAELGYDEPYLNDSDSISFLGRVYH